MIEFSVTLYGTSEHAERNAAQKLWCAIEREHAGSPSANNPIMMLIGKAEYTAPPGPKQRVIKS